MSVLSAKGLKHLYWTKSNKKGRPNGRPSKKIEPN